MKRQFKTTRFVPQNLIIDGFMRQSGFGIDYFVSIAQWFMREGYKDKIIITDCPEKPLQQFFMDCLFSYDCPIHRKRKAFTPELKLEVLSWRKQFNFQGMSIGGLNFYKGNKWFGYCLFKNTGLSHECLKFSPNSSWLDARYILNRGFIIEEDRFFYEIHYGTNEDFENKIKKQACSSWEFSIESEIGENFMDFCNRISKNYDKIMLGDKSVLIKNSEYGNKFFKLSKEQNI